jgi:DNA polymerase
MAIKKRLRNFPVPESVWEEYHIDQEINDRGILVDLDMAEQAITIDSRSRAALTEKLQEADRSFQSELSRADEGLAECPRP